MKIKYDIKPKRTKLYWFDLVKDPIIKEKIMKNTLDFNKNINDKNAEHESLEFAVGNSFIFEGTPEGETFWANLNYDDLI